MLGFKVLDKGSSGYPGTRGRKAVTDRGKVQGMMSTAIWLGRLMGEGLGERPTGWGWGNNSDVGGGSGHRGQGSHLGI